MPRSIVVAFVTIAASCLAPALAQQPAAPTQLPTQQQPRTQQLQVQPRQPAQPPAARSPFNEPPARIAWMDQVLTNWERDSQTVQNFYCEFERDTHNIMGPGDGRPFAKERGKLGYHKPDRGSFQITQSKIWTPKAAAATPGETPQQSPAIQGEYKTPKDANGKDEPGEHWVCNGKNVYQYRRHTNPKRLVVTPIPAGMQGKEIVNGPLPFLFGAEADKLKERFWMRGVDELSKNGFIGIHAKPKRQVDAAEYSDVWVVLRNEPGKPLMPAGLRVVHPNKSWDEYRFDLKNAQVNSRLAGVLAHLFQEPRKPFGWERVEEPLRQAQQSPLTPPR